MYLFSAESGHETETGKKAYRGAAVKLAIEQNMLTPALARTRA
jgi:hypothetical protein